MLRRENNCAFVCSLRRARNAVPVLHKYMYAYLYAALYASKLRSLCKSRDLNRGGRPGANPVFIGVEWSKRHSRGVGNGKLAGAVPDARRKEQHWLSGPVAGAAAAVTTRMSRQAEGLGIDIMTRAGTCHCFPPLHTTLRRTYEPHCYCIITSGGSGGAGPLPLPGTCICHHPCDPLMTT